MDSLNKKPPRKPYSAPTVCKRDRIEKITEGLQVVLTAAVPI